MGQPLSMDLRVRLLAAIHDGMSCRAASVRFGVAPSTAIRWQRQRRETGGFAPKRQGRDMRSRRIEERRAYILAVWEARKDISLAELRLALVEVGLRVSAAGLHRLFVRHGMTRKKKTGNASEQDRPDVQTQRREWFDGQPDLESERLVFIDGTWTATNMTRSHGRCRKGERLRMGYPHGHRKTTTLVAALRMAGMVAPRVLDGPINGAWLPRCGQHDLFWRRSRASEKERDTRHNLASGASDA